MSLAKRKKNKKFNNFLMFPRKILFKCDEWKNLTPSAKLLYLHLKGKYNGHNNGEIRLYYSELKGVKGISSPSTISEASKELQDRGWIERTKLGGLYRHYNDYKLTGKHDDCI